MANYDPSTVAAALKEKYDGQETFDDNYRKSPLVAMMKKNEDYGGKAYPVPILTAASSGVSPDFVTAQTNQYPALQSEFMVTTASGFAVATISELLMRTAQKAPDTFMNQVDVLMEQARKSLQDLMGNGIYGTGTGTLAQFTSHSTATLTLANPGDAFRFSFNQGVQAAATDGGTPRAASGFVVGLDLINGTVTVSTTQGGAPALPSGWSDNDYLMLGGSSNAQMYGLGRWIPTPTFLAANPSLWGVTYSADPRRRGVYLDGTGRSIKEALTTAIVTMGRFGADIDYVSVSHDTYGALLNEMGAREVIVEAKAPSGADISFAALEIIAGRSRAKIVPDQYCTPKSAYLLQMNTWELLSAGAAPSIFQQDGNIMLRVSNSPAYEVRMGYFANPICKAPIYNGVVALDV